MIDVRSGKNRCCAPSFPTADITRPDTMKSSSRALMIVLLTVPLGGVGIDLYASSLPALAKHFGASAIMAKSTLTVFLAGLVVGMLYSGTVSDVVGRKRPQLVNALLFTLSSAAIPFAATIHQVLILRLLQGMSAGGMQAVCRSILSDSFRPQELTRKSLYVTTVWGMGPIFAPWIGGLLMTAYGWASSFYVLAGYGLLLAVLMVFALPETNTHRARLSVAGLRRDVTRVIGHEGFLLPVLAMGFAYACLVSYGSLGPYFVQVALGLSPATYGNIGLLVGCGYLLGNLALRTLLGRRWPENVLLGSAVFATLAINVASIAMQWMWFDTNAIWIACVLADCFMMGFIYPVYMAASLRVHPERSGLASAMTVSAVLFLASLFSVVASALTLHSARQFVAVYLVLSVGIMAIRLWETARRPATVEAFET